LIYANEKGGGKYWKAIAFNCYDPSQFFLLMCSVSRFVTQSPYYLKNLINKKFMFSRLQKNSKLNNTQNTSILYLHVDTTSLVKELHVSTETEHVMNMHFDIENISRIPFGVEGSPLSSDGCTFVVPLSEIVFV